MNKEKSDTIATETHESIDVEYSSLKNESWVSRLVRKLEVQPRGDLTTSQMFLYNYDLRPVEKARRTWRWYNYMFYWISDSFNINTWQIAATGIQSGGLTWWQAWIAVWLGYFMCGIFVSVGSRIGVLYHISFPVAARSSFGIYGSLWPVINRVVMSCVWYAVQCSVAGPCVEVMLRAIFGQHLDKTMPNHIHDPDLTTFKFLSFFLFWLFSLPFIWLPPHQLKHLFTVKSYVAPTAGVAFLVWALVKADGAGPVIHAKAKVEGSALGWAFVEATMNSLANFATIIVNAPDFARFSTKASFSMKYIVYTISVPVCFSLTSLIGILVTSAAQLLYGVMYWSPLDVLARFLDDYTAGNRAGVFLLGFSFAIAQLGTNISANSLSFGTDVSAILPRFMNIRRGGYLCAAIALCVCPWKLTSSSSKFTTYLSAYAVFLSAIAGVVACDYFYVRRGYIKLTHLYSMHAPEDPSVHSIYRFSKIGVNWRAYTGYICGIFPNIVGFVGATGTHVVPLGAVKLYRLNFLAGFSVSFLVYAVICRIWPAEGTPEVGPFEKTWLEENADVEYFEEEIMGITRELDQYNDYAITSSAKMYEGSLLS